VSAPFLSLEKREELRERMSPEAKARFDQIIHSYKLDLTANLRGTFAVNDFVEIINRAGSMFAHELEATPELSFADIESAWTKVVTDFFRSRYWGFTLLEHGALMGKTYFGLNHEHLEAHEREKIESDGNLKKAMPYLRQFVIGLIIWKILVIYFAQQGCFDWGILRR